ncbi:MAG: hypothetical protein COW28_01950, partial [bacterium (Candidatus Ratteibacteria) CG15_BIG_FIL_POST_REV_8_21_14_020_41_12]
KQVEMNSQKVNSSYKQTPIGRIPREWRVIKLAGILNLKNGQRPTFLEKGSFPVYGANGIMGYTNGFLVENDFTVIFGRVGASGEVHIAEGKTWVSDNAIYSKTYDKEKVQPKFLFYLLSYKKLKQFAAKTTHPIITQTFLNSFKIPLPPLLEQQKIAEILSAVDEGIGKVDEVIKKTERLKKGLMQKLLTEGIGHREFKDSEIGKIPKEWEVEKLSGIGEIITGTTPSTKIEEYWGEGHPFVTPTDFSDKKYVDKTERYVTQKGIKKARIIPKNSVMVTCIASVGEISMASMECITNQQINTIVCNNGINPHYVYYIMLFRKNILKRWAGITTSPIIKKSLFEKFPLPLPPLPEQQKIAGILADVDKKVELERERKGKLERIKKGLMSDLLSGRKRVKI